MLRKMFSDKRVYERCGLDVRESVRQARSNHVVNDKRHEFFESLHQFLDENGLMNPISRMLWRRSGFLA